MESSFFPEANIESIGEDTMVTFQNAHEENIENQIMVDIIHPGIPYKGIEQTYITQSSQFIDNPDEIQTEGDNSQQIETKKKKKKKKKKNDKKNKKATIKSNSNFDGNNANDGYINPDTDFSLVLDQNEKHSDICPNTPTQMPIPNNEGSTSQLDQNNQYISIEDQSMNNHYINRFDASNPNHIFSSLSIENNEKLKKEISDNLRVQRIKEKRKREEEFRIKRLEEEDIKVKTRLSALQEQKLQRIVINHENYRARSQKALKQRQILEEVKLKTAQSAMIKMETAEKRKLQILQAKQEMAMQRAADEWLKRHFAQQAKLQMERRKQRQLKILAQKEKESTIRVQKIKTEMMKKEQKRRTVMKKYYASVPT